MDVENKDRFLANQGKTKYTAVEQEKDFRSGTYLLEVRKDKVFLTKIKRELTFGKDLTEVEEEIQKRNEKLGKRDKRGDDGSDNDSLENMMDSEEIEDFDDDLENLKMKKEEAKKKDKDGKDKAEKERQEKEEELKEEAKNEAVKGPEAQSDVCLIISF